MTPVEQVRTFIAIELPENIKEELSKLQNEIKSPKEGFVKWVMPKGIHLTLKFLGNIDTKQIAAVIQSIEKGSRGETSFRLNIGEPGVFPNYRRPRVLWVAVGGDIEKLLRIQKNIDDQLGLLGFPSEKRPFSPHITLARLGERATTTEVTAFGEKIKGLPYKKSFEFLVNNIYLMRSQLFPTGAVYTRLSQSELQIR